MRPGRHLRATKAGSGATLAFSGTKVVWFGPTGPTRGTARVFIDGAYVKTVDLRRSSFSAHVAVYSRTWTTAATHTIKIEVVGTSTHPMVAIDEFVVKS